MERKIAKGWVLVAPLPATAERLGLIMEGSRKHPQNKGVVELVGQGDEFGEIVWKAGDVVLLPSTGILSFDDMDGRLMKLVHHRRIPFGYEAEL